MEALLIVRKTRRAQLTKYSNLIQKELNKPDPPKTVKLERLLLELDAKIDAVKNTHSNCADAAAASEEQDADTFMEEQISWLEDRSDTRDTLVELLLSRRGNSLEGATPNHSTQDDQSDRASVTTAGSRPYIKLGKLSTMTFDGSQENQFPAWQADHECRIFNNDSLNPAEKMRYLQEGLTLTPRDMTVGFPATQEGYEAAFKLICERYGRKEKVRNRHIAGLLYLEAPTAGRQGPDVSTLYAAFNSISMHVRSLESLLVMMKVEDILIPLIISKFPDSFKHEFSKAFRDDNVTLSQLLSFLQREIERYEFVQDISHTMRDAPDNIDRPQTFAVRSKIPPTGSAVSLYVAGGAAPQPPTLPPPPAAAAGGGIRCYYCQGDHYSKNCPKFNRASIAIRRDMAYQARLCIKCLRPGHKSNMCNANCKRCLGAHATPLCDIKTGQNGVGFTPPASFAAPWGQYGTQLPQLQSHTGRAQLPNNMVAPSGTQNHGPPMAVQSTLLQQQQPVGTNSTTAQGRPMEQANAFNVQTNGTLNATALGFNTQLNPFSPQYQPSHLHPTQSSQNFGGSDTLGFRKVTRGEEPPGGAEAVTQSR